MSKTDIKKIDKVVDFSNLRKMPERLPLHWGYVIFFGVSMVAALWQHGSPLLSLGLLVMLFPAGAMAYIPYKRYGSAKRFYLQLFIVALSGAWFIYRKQQGVPIDKATIESCCIVGLSLLFAQRAADYDYLLLVSIFLLMYGALLPRAIFIATFLIAVILGSVLLYSSRIKSFSGQVLIDKKSSQLNFAVIPVIFTHLILAGIIFWGVLSLLPERDPGHKGLFEVSFNTRNDSFIPPGFKKWFTFKKVKSGKKGRLINSGKKPTVLGRKGAKVSLKKGTYMSSQGNGASPPSKKLIFKVDSPVKLYWVAQLYDRYDGIIWTRSKYLTKSNNFGYNYKQNRLAKISTTVEQHFIIENWVSPKLFAAYRPLYFEISGNQDNDIKLKSTFYNSELVEKRYPALPFTYNVSSELSLPGITNKNKDLYWNENVKKGFYLRLPRKKLSKRLKTLAIQLCRNKIDPLQKALALRNFLRNNYKYKQYSKPVPPHREAVDYFIFDLKAGHCEYFASALAVLARLNGLPSRVATGFSPGNYNLLSGYFEVHEYNAHAWTQIYIKNMGWLTFDATPPGSIQSRTTPFGFGSFRDPFGDEWRVMPPELTDNTLKYVKAGVMAKLSLSHDPQLTAAEQALVDISMTKEKLENQFNTFINRTFHNIKGLSKLSLWYKKIKEQLSVMGGKILEAVRVTAEVIINHLAVSLAVIAILIALSIEITILRRLIRRRLILKKCHNFFHDACQYVHADPRQSIELCYLLTRQLLILAGLPRRNNDELLNYGKSLNDVHSKLCIDTVRIFYAFTKYEYSTKLPTVAEAALVLKRTGNICKILYSMIDESGEINKAA